MKNLIISAVGDSSLHREWISGDKIFDLALIYYGDNSLISKEYEEEANFFWQSKGMKYHLIDSFLKNNQEIFEEYEFIWFPDDDVSISTDAINQLFEIAKKETLQLCQPAMTGYISHLITKPSPRLLLRFTNFIEVIAPLMHIETVKILQSSFTLNFSGWGFDYLWSHLLGNPRNTIAIIDAISMKHTKPVGKDYSRFPVHPKKEMKKLFRQFEGKIKERQVIYSLRAL